MIEQHLNKIYNVDCLEFMKTLPDKCIDLVLTDPPYGMSFQSNHRKIKHAKIENDSNLDWLPNFVDGVHRVLKDNTHAYFFCSFHNVDVFKQEIQKMFNVKNILIWCKNNTGMGDLFGDYAPQYEMCIYAQKGSRKLNGGRDSNLMYFDRTGNNFHPTEKPVEMMEFLIEKSSLEKDVVLDTFMGGGSTAIACKQTNRNFIGCELSKEYCDIAEKRLSSLTQNLF